MKLVTDQEARAWIEHPRLAPYLEGPEMHWIAPRSTTIYVEHEGFLAIFHPAPAWGVFFVHVAALPGTRDVARKARDVLDFTREKFPQIETILGIVSADNGAVRSFARRIGFRTTARIETARGPRLLVEAA